MGLQMAKIPPPPYAHCHHAPLSRRDALGTKRGTGKLPKALCCPPLESLSRLFGRVGGGFTLNLALLEKQPPNHKYL